MNHLNETLYCGSIACAAEGHKGAQQDYLVDLLANISKHNVTRFPYLIARLAQDIAGGILGHASVGGGFRFALRSRQVAQKILSGKSRR